MLASYFKQSLRVKVEDIFSRITLRGNQVVFVGKSSTLESAFLKWCLENHVIEQKTVETLLDRRLKALGRLMLDQAVRKEVESPEALAYAARNGVFNEKELQSIEPCEAVSITMQNRADNLFKGVMQQLLHGPELASE